MMNSIVLVNLPHRFSVIEITDSRKTARLYPGAWHNKYYFCFRSNTMLSAVRRCVLSSRCRVALTTPVTSRRSVHRTSGVKGALPQTQLSTKPRILITGK